MRLFSRVFLLSLPILCLFACSDDEDEVQVPDAPANFNVSAFRYTSLHFDITWDWTEHADEYELERRSGGGGWHTLTYGDQTWYSDFDVEFEVEYTYRVKAENWDAGYSQYSEEVSVMVPLLRPPSNIILVPSPACIVMTWDQVDSIDYYKVQRADLTEATSYRDLDNVYNRHLPYRDCDNIEAGHTYSYRISSYGDLFGEGDYASASATASDLMPPSTIQATDGTSPLSVTVSWEGYDFADSYIVLRSPDGNAPWDTVATNVTTTSTTDAAITVGIPYYYTVVTVLGQTISPEGNPDDGYAGTLLSEAPPAPSTPTYSGSDLRWTAVSGATAYRVYRTDELGGTMTAVSDWIDSLMYRDTSMVSGKWYWFAVSARNPYGESSLSEDAVGYIGTQPQLGDAPRLTLVSADSTTVSLTWTADTAAGSYTLHRGERTGSIDWQEIADGIESCTYVDSTTILDTAWYRVAAVLPSGGVGLWSDTLAVTLAVPDTADSGSGLGATDSLMVDTAMRFFVYGTLVCTVTDTINITDYRPEMVTITRNPDSTVIRKNWDYYAGDPAPTKPYAQTDTLQFIDHSDSTSTYRLTGILSRVQTTMAEEPTQSRIVTNIVGTLSLTGGRFSEIRYDMTETQTVFQPAGNWEIRYTGTVYYDDVPVVVDDVAPVLSN